jgi:hypothetical protein
MIVEVIPTISNEIEASSRENPRAKRLDLRGYVLHDLLSITLRPVVVPLNDRIDPQDAAMLPQDCLGDR